jgi:hypothetical protein
MHTKDAHAANLPRSCQDGKRAVCTSHLSSTSAMYGRPPVARCASERRRMTQEEGVLAAKPMAHLDRSY